MMNQCMIKQFKRDAIYALCVALPCIILAELLVLYITIDEMYFQDTHILVNGLAFTLIVACILMMIDKCRTYCRDLKWRCR